MTATRQPPRLSPRERKPRLTWVDNGRPLTPQRLDQLWAAYLADRSDQRLRNRLVEHYLPFIRNMAESIAKSMRLRDEEDAVGEVLLALVESIVPGYDGRRNFESWAGLLVKRKLVDQQRGGMHDRRPLRQRAVGTQGTRPAALPGAARQRPELRRVHRRVERSPGGGPLAAVLPRHVGKSGRGARKEFTPQREVLDA